MTHSIPIPPEAEEEAAKAIYEHWQFRGIFGVVNVPLWVPRGNSVRQEQCRDFARAAIAAAFAAWRGATDKYPGDGTKCLILPLPSEGGEK